MTMRLPSMIRIKKEVKLRAAVLLILLAFAIGLPALSVYADSPEILQNPGFEQDIEHWQAAVNGTLLALESYGGVTPQSGKYFMYMNNRYGSADTPMQRIEPQLRHYGPGTYRMSAYFRLPEGVSVNTLGGFIAIRIVSSDSSYGSPQFPGINWIVSQQVTINKTSWTQTLSEVDIDWPAGKLSEAEFYFVTKPDEDNVDICIDSVSMVKVGFTGDPFTPPAATPTPTRAPTKPATPTPSPSPSPTGAPTAVPTLTTPATVTPSQTPSQSSGSEVTAAPTQAHEPSEPDSGAASGSSDDSQDLTSGEISQTSSVDESGDSHASVSPGTDEQAPFWGIGRILLLILGGVLFGAAGIVLIWNFRLKKNPGLPLPERFVPIAKILTGNQATIYIVIFLLIAALAFMLMIALIPNPANPQDSQITSSQPLESTGSSEQMSEDTSGSETGLSGVDASGVQGSSADFSGSGSLSAPSISTSSASSSMTGSTPTTAPYIPTPTPSAQTLQQIAARDLAFVSPTAPYRVTDLMPQIRLPISEMQQKKMGGALVSVNWGKDYLNNELSWIALNQDLQRLTDANMTAWIWDEKGFPSGSAGGLATEGRPDLEARGVFKISVSGEGSQYKEILLPADGERILSAVVYPVENGQVNFSKGSIATFSDGKASTNGRAGKWELWAAVEAILLEAGGDPSEAGKQFDTSGKIINLMNRDAVGRFIDVTYEKYKSKLHLFGERITGFISGEANLQTIYAYTNQPRPSGRAYFAWDAAIPGIYKQRYGTDLAPLLPMMLGGDNEINKRLRYQYYTIVGDLVSENYTGQLTQWCEQNGVLSSGYLFGQEYISKHVWLQGNLMQVIGRYNVPVAEIGLCPIAQIGSMDYSGIKYVASAARLEGKYNTMIYMDPLMGGYPANTGFEIDANTLIANLNVYAQFGFSQTGTYGHYNTADVNEYAKYNEYAGRLNVMLRGAVDRSRVAMYYPIETFQGRSIPTAAFYHGAYTPYNDIEIPQKEIFKALSGQSVDFNHIDARAVLNATIQNKTLVIGNYAYQVVIMPAVELIELEVIRKLNQFEAAGGKVIYYQSKPSIAGKPADNQALRAAVSDKMIVSNIASLLPMVRETVDNPVAIEAGTLISYAQFTKDTRHVIFVANKMGVSGSITISVAHAKNARILNPETGEIINVSLPHTMNLGGYRGVFVEITG